MRLWPPGSCCGFRYSGNLAFHSVMAAHGLRCTDDLRGRRASSNRSTCICRCASEPHHRLTVSGQSHFLTSRPFGAGILVTTTIHKTGAIGTRQRWQPATLRRHGIVSRASERMATQNAHDSQPQATKCSVAFHGFDGVLRTRRHEAAGIREQGRDPPLVAAKHELNSRLHFRSAFVTDCVSCASRAR